MHARSRDGAPMIVLALLLAGIAAGCSPPPPVEVTPLRLANGLEVRLRAVPGASDVAVVVHYNLGGDHDPEGRSGLAHLTEHLYVTARAGATPARSAQEFMARHPAGANAQTGDRYTVFAAVVPPPRLDAELEEAAARMGSLEITPADLDRERPRLLDEIGAMFETVPALAALNRAREIVRPTPRGGRRGGVPGHVQAITLDEVREHWRRYYKPRNAILSIAGDFDPDAASLRASLERHFGGITPGESPPAPGEPGTGRGIQEPATRPTVRNGTVAVAVAAPLPSDRLYPAYLVLVARMLKLAGTPVGGFQVHAAILDDPAVAAISTNLRAEETDGGARRRLAERLSALIDVPLGDGEPAETSLMLGMFLGTADLPGGVRLRNVYGAAFAEARRAGLGINPADMRTRLGAVTADDVRIAADAVFGESRRGYASVAVPGGR